MTSSFLLLVLAEGFAREGQREGWGLDLEWVLVLLEVLVPLEVFLEEENPVEYQAEYQLARRLGKEDQEVGGAGWVLDSWILLQYPLS